MHGVYSEYGSESAALIESPTFFVVYPIFTLNLGLRMGLEPDAIYVHSVWMCVCRRSATTCTLSVAVLG